MTAEKVLPVMFMVAMIALFVWVLSGTEERMTERREACERTCYPAASRPLDEGEICLCGPYDGQRRFEVRRPDGGSL